MSIKRSRPLAAIAVLAAATLTCLATPSASGASAPHGGPNAADYEQVILSNHPAIYYRLGEASGPTAVDSSGHGRDATYSGKPVFGLPGAIKDDPDTQVGFNTGKSDDYATWNTGDQRYRGMFSVEAWVTPSAGGQGMHDIVDTADIRTYAFDLALNGYQTHSIWLMLGNGTGWYVTGDSDYAWRAGRTYYIAVVAASRQVNIYVNGKLLTSQPYASPRKGGKLRPPMLYSSNDDLFVGLHPSTGHKLPFKGDIDEVAIYQHRLSADQVAAHYAAGQ